MAFYAVDVRDRVIQRVTREYTAVDNKRFFLIEAGSAKQAWAKAGVVTKPTSSSDCSWCRHHHCTVCEECSAAKQYSDYWICHCCGELNPRASNVHLKEVSNGLGEN
jgi:hypothetical protein